MFRDAAALDRQRTATAFDKALKHYGGRAEKWFDGSANSVDARLAACEKLLHSARATVARFSSINDSRPYLVVAGALNADRYALLALRDDLLTGASGREDVVGPPGWRTSREKSPGAVAGSNEFRHPAPRTKKPRYLDEVSVTKVSPLTAALHQADGPPGDHSDDPTPGGVIPSPGEKAFLGEIADNFGDITFGAPGTRPGKMWLGQGGSTSTFEPQMRD